jgi:hypothetical protein
MSGEANEPDEVVSFDSNVQYLREINCIISTSTGEGYDFDDFRVSFIVKRGDLQTPNSCDVRIYNLSDQTANVISGKEYTQLTLNAGYAGNSGLIFKGTIKQVRKGRVNQLDSYVDVTAADGDEAYNFAPIFVSVKSGTTPGQLADILLQSFQSKTYVTQTVVQGYQPNFPKNGCVRGKVLYGMARDEARYFAWANNCAYSVQDSTLNFIPFTSYVPGPIPVISPTTGLIGVPEQTNGGIRIKTLLNPNIKVGQLIKLDSKNINLFRYSLDYLSIGSNLTLKNVIKTNADGLYYVMVANHSGDTRATEWYTDTICLSVDATNVGLNPLNSLTVLNQNVIPRYD